MFHPVVAFTLLCLTTASVIPETEDRIVGGIPSAIAIHPYQVSLQLDKSHFCGGTLYSRRIVITAAHCISGVQMATLPRLQVRLGSNDWSAGGVVRAFADMKVHPQYNRSTMVNDVALVKLASPVTYSSKIRNISLQVDNPFNGAPGVISGWGTLYAGANVMPTILRSANVKLISRDKCASSAYNYTNAIQDTMICAGANGRDSCQGDSGGPLVSKRTGKLVGIASWGLGCAQRMYPGVYSLVPKLRQWIINNAKIL